MFNIRQVDRFAFSKHFIKQAFIEFRLDKQIKGDWEEIHNQINSKISSSKLNDFGVNINYKTNLNLHERKNHKELPEFNISRRSNGIVLSDKTGSQGICLDSKKILVTTNKYTCFEDLMTIAFNFNDFLNEIVPGRKIVWIGIRKINKLGITTDNSCYNGEGVNPIFFKPIDADFFEKDKLTHGDSRYVLKDGDHSFIINVTFDKHNDPNKYNLTIDLDSNSKVNKNSDAEIKKELLKLNNEVFNVFCSLLSKDLMEELK